MAAQTDLVDATQTDAAAVEPWRAFAVQVRAVQRLSPSFVRITFTGDDLDRFADPGLDQRIKLVLPAEGREGFEGVPLDLGWAGIYDLPDDVRPSVRTYTTRAVRPLLREVDVDMVLHGDGGPASRFAGSAAPGDVAALLGPDAGFDGDPGGLEFRAPAGTPGAARRRRDGRPGRAADPGGAAADHHRRGGARGAGARRPARRAGSGRRAGDVAAARRDR